MKILTKTNVINKKFNLIFEIDGNTTFLLPKRKSILVGIDVESLKTLG